MKRPKALIVDDDPDFCASLALLVERQGFETRSASTLAAARELLRGDTADLVLLDLDLPDGAGLELMADDDISPRIDFIVVTGHASVDSVVTALRAGALDYLTKPIDRSRLATVLANVTRMRALRDERDGLRGELRELGRFGRLVGRSKPMQEVYDLIARVAPTDASVLLMGESGTGKELAGQTIHQLSRRKDGPFLAINCGAVASNLIESELFGHEKGSFTGADRRHLGFFERASGGTLMLDEITEMPAELQVKLLRVLESGRLARVGGTEPIEVDVRIVAATNRNPEEAVRSGRLREDLFYRLNVFPIAMPPLRNRKEDVELLAQHFLDELNRKEGMSKTWTAPTLERLRALPWTGNVRELRNAVERAFILSGETIGPGAVGDPGAANVKPEASGIEMGVGTSIAEMERRLILATLEHLDGDKKQAARLLGISLKTLYNRLSVYRASEGR